MTDLAAVAPHRRRRLSGDTLLTTDAGTFAVLDRSAMADYLAGRIEPGHRFWLKLQSAGLLRQYLDFDDLARRTARGGLLAYAGPPRHRIPLGMGLEMLREVLDRLFLAAPPRLAIELVGDGLGAAWPKAWFAVEYAQRKAEWSGRVLSVCLRAESGERPTPEQAEFLAGRGASLRLDARVVGAPGELDLPKEVPIRLRAVVGARAKDPAGWARAWADAGVSSVRLEPGDIRAFGRFYSGYLDALLAPDAHSLPREEWTEAALSRVLRPESGAWEDESTDILGGISYSPDGKAVSVAAESEVLAALSADNQPLCAQCAYAPYCRPSPAAHLRDQGTLWGRTPSSAQCAQAMIRWDALFERLRQEPLREAMAGWLDGATGGFY